MNRPTLSISLISLWMAGMAPARAADGTPAVDGAAENPYDTATEAAPEANLSGTEAPAPARLVATNDRYARTEKDLEANTPAAGEAAVIETSRPYLLPRLFTIPTAYSLQSYEVRFGGQGNIHATMANMNTEGVKGSVSVGLGGIMELGYQLDEYYTVEEISDKILMGYFKLSVLKESRFLPAVSISASKNLRANFYSGDTGRYTMDEDMYELVLSKAFRFGDHMVSLHPGLQVIRDEIKSVNRAELAKHERATKFNPRLGLSWQSRPKTLFMYELKMLQPTLVSSLGSGEVATNQAMENNLGVRYYLRNWLCIDAGIRHFYDLELGEDDMKLHANFVGVVPLASLYERIGSYFGK